MNNPFSALPSTSTTVQEQPAAYGDANSKRNFKGGIPLIAADQEPLLRVLYFEQNHNSSHLAERMGVKREQMHAWLNRKGWPAQRRAALGIVTLATERTITRLVNRHAAELEAIEDATVRESLKETEALGRTQHPGKRLLHARTLSTLLSSFRAAGGQQGAGANGFPFGFLGMIAQPGPTELKQAVTEVDSVSIPVSSEPSPGETG